MSAGAMTSARALAGPLRREKPTASRPIIGATPEFDRKLKARLGCRTRREMLDRLGVDYEVWLKPKYVGPRLPRMQDEFGRRFRGVDYGAGRYREWRPFPLAGFKSVAEIERNYACRCPTVDFSGVPAQAARAAGHPIAAAAPSLSSLQGAPGMEQAFVDLVGEPGDRPLLPGQALGLAYECAVRIYEAVPAGRHLLHREDMGGQTDLMISVRHIREVPAPGMKRMIDLATRPAPSPFHHNDGSCWRIIPDMIGLGIDLLNPSSGAARHGAGAAQERVRGRTSSCTAAWTTSTRCRSGRSKRSGARSRIICASWGRRRLHPGALSQYPGDHARRERSGYVRRRPRIGAFVKAPDAQRSHSRDRSFF